MAVRRKVKGDNVWFNVMKTEESRDVPTAQRFLITYGQHRVNSLSHSAALVISKQTNVNSSISVDPSTFTPHLQIDTHTYVLSVKSFFTIVFST